MAYNDIAPIPKRMTIVMGLSVVGLMAFGLAISYYKSVLFDQQLILMHERNTELRAQVSQTYKTLAYLQSSQYVDKYAKENFNVLRPGEKVLYIHEKESTTVPRASHDITEEEKAALYEENLRNIPVIDHWRLYLFDHDKIDALRLRT